MDKVTLFAEESVTILERWPLVRGRREYIDCTSSKDLWLNEPGWPLLRVATDRHHCTPIHVCHRTCRIIDGNKIDLVQKLYIKWGMTPKYWQCDIGSYLKHCFRIYGYSIRCFVWYLQWRNCLSAHKHCAYLLAPKFLKMTIENPSDPPITCVERALCLPIKASQLRPWSETMFEVTLDMLDVCYGLV